jgi:hypothetical protein
MKFRNIFFVLVVTAFFSCESNEIEIDTINLLYGTWVEPTYNNETTTFKRGATLPKEAYGVAFNKDGIFTEKTSGWCGTPPLSFFNIEGTFQLENTLISITTQSYPTNYAWRIVALTKEKLVIKREVTAQEIEHSALMDLFIEIENLTYAETCSIASDWTFVAYGSKACGGPKGYIAYSKNIDTASFLEKIEKYTKAEKEFNIKWSIISDCSLAAVPITVECQNGYPTLIY